MEGRLSLFLRFLARFVVALGAGTLTTVPDNSSPRHNTRQNLWSREVRRSCFLIVEVFAMLSWSSPTKRPSILWVHRSNFQGAARRNPIAGKISNPG